MWLVIYISLKHCSPYTGYRIICFIICNVTK
uniref:Uncharacterized protein n=1 Tax=Myoviridae sp. ctxjh1 TaxID=2826714 RepID=A0A8S5R0S1_9CAUD|nr:MAG TPA: hypothetical protein [Myoviridae sp. ctxjh1]DAV72581.1 MAG TPA: hypothetical protein [Caudoviricetes sp.]